MMPSYVQIPFTHNDKACVLEVKYSVNTDPVTSGFEIVKNLIPDLSICVGYPVIHAYIKEHEGYGFCRYYGFIQTVTIENVNETFSMLDVAPCMGEMGIPFFSYGYQAEAYDAPVNNYGVGTEIKWTAQTFLVDIPSYVNNNSISFMAGFKWGYEEQNIDQKRNIGILPITIVDKSVWVDAIPLLSENCPKWNFV